MNFGIAEFLLLLIAFGVGFGALMAERAVNTLLQIKHELSKRP